MDLQHVIACMTPEIYENLKEAIALGRWQDGRRLTAQQLESSLSAVIAYESKHIPETERVGYIDRGKKAEGDACPTADIQIIEFKE
jgi:uncharacterized protein YeaC (DUF1315 family)